MWEECLEEKRLRIGAKKKTFASALGRISHSLEIIRVRAVRDWGEIIVR